MSTVVIGKSGQLAQELALIDSSIVCLGHSDIDLTDYDNVASTLARYKPNKIINAAAYTAVDKAESDQESAYALNCQAVENLAKYAHEHHAHLVHVSTDYVFSGDKGSPYLVDDKYAPIGVYGDSKAKGEQALLNIHADNSCIIRTSWVYSHFGNNFVKTMLRLMAEKPELGVIDDQIGSPTSAKALAHACKKASDDNIVGVFHFTDAGVASWYDFAVAIQEIGIKYGILLKPIPIKPIPTSAYPTPAKRPSYSVLDKSSLLTAFDGLQPKHWRVELDEVIRKLTLN